MTIQSSVKVIREKIQSGIPSVGTWMQISNAEVAYILSSCSYDWIAVDLEHGLFSPSELPSIFRSIKAGGSLPLARVASPSRHACKAALEAGAAGIIIPMVEDPLQLNQLISASTLPPNGFRGVGFSSGNLYGKQFSAYLSAGQSPLIVAMIETVEGLHNLPDILKVKGLDAVMIGPYDLSASLGVVGDFDSPIYQEALSKFVSCVSASPLAAGMHVVQPSSSQLHEAVNSGYLFIAYSIDSVFLGQLAVNPLITPSK